MSMRISLAYVRIRKFKKGFKKIELFDKKQSILKQIRAFICSDLRSIDQQEDSLRTGKLSQKHAKNDEKYENFCFSGMKSE